MPPYLEIAGLMIEFLQPFLESFTVEGDHVIVFAFHCEKLIAIKRNNKILLLLDLKVSDHVPGDHTFLFKVGSLAVFPPDNDSFAFSLFEDD